VAPAEKAGPVWTILELLRWATTYFTSHGIEQPRPTAEVLLAHILGCRRIDLYLRYDQPLHRDELAGFKQVILRRVNAEPVAYITGEKEFWSLSLSVNRDVLIPRPETECLVEAALRLMPKGPCGSREGSRPCRVLDLGTGSGAIILALASERPDARYFALDRSPTAVAVARSNASHLGLEGRVRFLVGDWFSSIHPAVRFDLIVSNPPYVRRDAIPGLQPEIHRYEPHGALDGGPGGVDDLERIIQGAGTHLTPGGYVILEMGWDQRPQVERIAAAAAGYEAPVFFKDYAGLDRVIQLKNKTIA
jgi:release factor glutamine methyltransferase